MHTVARTLIVLGSLLSAADQAPGQGYVRGYGATVFDTSLLDATDFIAVRATWDCTIALRANGSIVGWGNRALANTPRPNVPAVKIATGYDEAAVALLADGSLIAWGTNNVFGELDVPTPPTGVVYTDCAISRLHGAAVRSDGLIATWGQGSLLTTPPALPTGVTYTAVSAGNDYFLALRSDGEIVGWGPNNLGQTTPPPLPAGVVYTQFDSTDLHNVALRSDGQIVSWGWPPWAMNVPALPAGMTYTQCRAGRVWGVALRSDGAVIAWGSNNAGQLNVPPLPSGVTVTELTAGWNHGAMLRSDGRIVSWGSALFAEDNFVAAHGGQNPVQIDADYAGAGVVFEDGTCETTGYLPYSQLPPLGPGQAYRAIRAGHGNLAGLRTDGTIAVAPGGFTLPSLPGGVEYVDVRVGPSGMLALRSDGLTEVAGQHPQLPAPPTGLRYLAIAAGPMHAGVLSNGNVVAPTTALFPPQPGGPAVRHVSTGVYHGVSLRVDGTIETWGTGYAVTTPALPAPPLPAGTTYVEVAAGANHSVARRSDGAMVVWTNRTNATPLQMLGESAPETTGIPGTTYNSVGAGRGQTVAVVGPNSTFVTFASGCAGSMPSSRIVPEDTPKIGRDFVVRIFDLPVGVAILAAGLSNTTAPFGPLPQSAAPLGAPGCTIHVSPDVTFTVGSAGSLEPAMHTLSIPNDANLLGATFYEQALVLDPGANPGGFVLSDAAAGVIGR